MSENYRDYWIPILISLLMHALLVGFIVSKWEWQSELKQVKTPDFVKATLVKKDPKKNKTKASKPKVEPKKEKPKKEEPKKPEPKKTEPKKTPEKKPEPKPESKPEPKKAESKPEKEQPKEPPKPDMDKLLEQMAEEDEESSNENQATEMEYLQGIIQQRVMEAWSRPASARQGMEVVLEIQMVPTGYIVNVTVVKSSGDIAFDLSAERAVRKIEQVPEATEISQEVFDKWFRKYKMVFRPEDLIR